MIESTHFLLERSITKAYWAKLMAAALDHRGYQLLFAMKPFLPLLLPFFLSSFLPFFLSSFLPFFLSSFLSLSLFSFSPFFSPVYPISLLSHVLPARRNGNSQDGRHKIRHQSSPLVCEATAPISLGRGCGVPHNMYRSLIGMHFRLELCRQHRVFNTKFHQFFPSVFSLPSVVQLTGMDTLVRSAILQ
jgi:hypothetical protein